jgi:hypothetical protein
MLLSLVACHSRTPALPLSQLVIIGALVMTAATSCAPPPTPEPPPAPVPGQTVQDWMRDLPGDAGSVVYLRNDGDRPIMITTFKLLKCVNLRQVCQTYTPEVIVPPGETVQLITLQPISQGARYSFRYEYQWKTMQ